MITRCHHCGAEFDVSTSLVLSRDPSVRCGQCMELFDAKANLYDKSEAAKAAATFKPVNPVRVDKIDMDALENAQTIAVEHRYVRANKATGITTADASYQQPDIDLSTTPEHIPEYVHDSESAARLEMEQTIAMQRESRSSIDSLSNNNLGAGISEHSFDPSRAVSRSAELPEAPDASQAAERMQKIRDRERRALDIEPVRELNDEHMQVVEEYKYRNHPSLDASTNVDETMAAIGATADAKTKDLEFIPDNALQQNTVHRESGWQQSAPTFKKDTPNFSTDKSGANVGMTESMVAPTVAPARQEHSFQGTHDFQVAHDKKTLKANDRDAVTEAPTHERRRPHSLDVSKRAEQSITKSNDTSAQEMRRYLSQRSSGGTGKPAVQRSNSYAERPSEYQRDRQAASRQTTTQRRTNAASSQSNSTWLWVLGLLVVGCIGLYVGRDSVANLDLPESILTPFCQITGCTPG